VKTKNKINDFDLLPSVMALMLLLPLSIFGAYAVSVIWEMFLVPTLPKISVLQGWGFVACATLAASDPTSGKDFGPMMTIVVRVLQIVFALGFAWCVHAVFA